MNRIAPLPICLACGLVVLPGGLAVAQTWSPPLGIPAPAFGITQVAPAAPSPWTSAVAGFYYVDATTSGATDTSNPYGTPGKPRRTIPSSLPAGAVVEVHGNYTKSHTSPSNIVAAGTAAQPVYIRGASPSTRPTMTQSWQVSGSYLVLENLTFAIGSGRDGLILLAPVDHVALRASEVKGNSGGGAVGVLSWNSSSSNNIVIYGNSIHDNGDVNATYDQDVHGIQVANPVSYVWVVDNQLYRNSGDGIQINGTRTGLHHVYVGRNVAYNNKQSGMWTKTASDVVFSQNKVYGHRPSGSSSGQGMGFQYDPQRVWFLFNECYDNTVGMNSGSADAGGRADIHFIGNVLHDNVSAGMELNGSVDREHVIGNTFYNNPIGLQNGYYPIGLEISDNIFSNNSTAHISFREYGSGALSNLRNSLFEAPVKIVWDDVTRDVAGMQSIGECQGCKTGSPLFVNAAGGDFNLQSSSPAIDGGVLEATYATFQTLYGIDIRKDRAERTRPQGAAWDMGAYEFGSGGSTAFTLTVAKAGTGTGTVTSSPAGISCGTDCSEPYNSGTVVTLTATATAGSSFSGWSGACIGTASCAVTMSAARSVTATFDITPASYTLSVVRAGAGSGTVTSSPAGISCGADCSEAYTLGTVVTLTATPAAGSSFSGWAGPCSGMGSCQVTMATAQSVIATFTLNSVSYTLTVLKEGTGGGTVTSSPAGVNCGTDCSEPYTSGTVVTLTAVPATGSTFAGWRNGICSGAGSCQVPMTAVQSVTATFNANPINYTLTVAKAGTGIGTVTSSPAGVSCGTDCSESYLPGTVVTLTAAPASGSTFAGWSGVCSGTGTCRVTMGAAMAVTATFAPVTSSYALTVVKSGTGGGTVTSSPAGINCGATCSASYTSGVLVTLTAAPAAGSTFSGWSGGVCSGTGSCPVTMSAAKSVTATFAVIPTTYSLTVARSGDGSGTVTSAPAGVNCGADCSEAYVSGTVVALTPTPGGGSVFAGWSGACTGTGAGQITMSNSRSVTASFALAMYSLTVTTTGSGSGTVSSSPAGISCGADCSEPYNRGTVVALTATPASGSTFGGWSGACTGTGACQATMDGAKSVGASFLTGGTPPPVGDFNRDGRIDLLWRHQTTGALYAWFLVGGTMASGGSLQPDRAARTWLVAGLGDLNRDTHTDLLWQNAKTGALTAWLMNGTRDVSSVAVPPIALPAPSTQSTGRQRRGVWQVRGLADFNRDGRDDIIWHHPQTGDLYAWFMNGTTPVSGTALSPSRFADTRWQLRGLADLNGDGQADLVWHHQTTGDIYVWLMNGTTAVGATYTNPSRFADTRWELVRVADFNKDGKPDLLWHHQTSGDLYVWYMNGLTATTAGYLTPNRPSSPDWQVAPR